MGSRGFPAENRGETYMEQIMVRQLALIGLPAMKTAPAGTVTGVPDRYLPGGNWIECKMFRAKGVAPEVPLTQLCTVPQRLFIAQHMELQDRVWLCVAAQRLGRDRKPWVAVLPWPQALELHRLPWLAYVELACDYNEGSAALRAYLAQRFHPSFERNSKWLPSA